MRTIIYADGGCAPTNPGPGGWGVVIVGPDGNRELCGGEPDTTNNRMELTAAIVALEQFPEGAQIEMRCDSEYVVNAASKWMRGWKAKGWRTTTGAVKNVDLMRRLDELAGRRDVRWTWVRGHAGDPLNERADRLVAQGRREGRGRPAQPAPSPVQTTASPATASPRSTDSETPRRTTQVSIDLAIGLEVSRAAKLAGSTPAAFIEACVKLVLALGPEETARLRAKMGPDSASAA
ncbi:Ribonuclease HI [Methylobacterium brachiatum]|nr:Ribonuclease HI [Methylobacterium brachiatum]